METQQNTSWSDESFFASANGPMRYSLISLWGGSAIAFGLCFFILGLTKTTLFTCGILLVFDLYFDRHIRRQLNDGNALVILMSDVIEAPNFSGQQKRFLWRDIKRISVDSWSGNTQLKFHLKTSAKVSDGRDFWTGNSLATPTLSLSPFSRNDQERLVDALNQRLGLAKSSTSMEIAGCAGDSGIADTPESKRGMMATVGAAIWRTICISLGLLMVLLAGVIAYISLQRGKNDGSGLFLAVVVAGFGLLAIFSGRIPRQFWQATSGTGKVAADVNEIAIEREFQEQLKSSMPHTWVVYGLVGANVLIWVVTLFGGAGFLQTPAERLLAWGGNAASEVQRGEWWRMISAMFLHSGFLHVLMNMVGLVGSGMMVERIYGRQLFALVYLGSGLIGSAMSLHFSGSRRFPSGRPERCSGLSARCSSRSTNIARLCPGYLSGRPCIRPLFSFSIP